MTQNAESTTIVFGWLHQYNELKNFVMYYKIQKCIESVVLGTKCKIVNTILAMNILSLKYTTTTLPSVAS